MFYHKRSILENEQYRLISAITQARKQMRQLHQKHLYVFDCSTARIPVILAELRFRYLLHQARVRKWSNVWDLD
jgi:hypothetical protein